MKVHVPTHLHDYTDARPVVEAEGATLDALTKDLDRSCPGLRFRIVDEQDQIRRHIRIFVNGREARTLATRLKPGDEVHVVAALSGG